MRTDPAKGPGAKGGEGRHTRGRLKWGQPSPAIKKNGNVISASKSKPDLTLEPRTTSVKEAPNLEGDLKLKKGEWWGME